MVYSIITAEIESNLLHLDRNKSNSFDNAASPGGQSMVVHCPHSRSILVILHRVKVKGDLRYRMWTTID
jgi:hypothetical protein